MNFGFFCGGSNYNTKHFSKETHKIFFKKLIIFINLNEYTLVFSLL